MWGCWSRAARRISRRNRSGADDGGELGAEHLEGDLPVVLEVVGEVDGRHAALAQLALDAVALVERPVQLAGGGHGLQGGGGPRRAPASRSESTPAAPPSSGAQRGILSAVERTEA